MYFIFYLFHDTTMHKNSRTRIRPRPIEGCQMELIGDLRIGTQPTGGNDAI